MECDSKYINFMRENMISNYFFADEHPVFLHMMEKEFKFDINKYQVVISGVHHKYFDYNDEAHVKSKIDRYLYRVECCERIAKKYNIKIEQILLKLDNSKQNMYIITMPQSSIISIEQLLNEFQQFFPEYQVKSPYFFSSYSNVYSGIENLHKAYIEARYLNDLSFFNLNLQYINQNNINHIKNHISLETINNKLSKLKAMLNTQDDENIIDYLNSLFTDVRDSLNTDIFTYFYFRMCSILTTMASIYQVDLKLTLDYKSLNYFFIDEYFSYFVKNIKILLPQRNKNIPTNILFALAYINENYTNNTLSLNDIADFTGTNASYISNEFSKYMHMPIIKYINTKRVEKVKYYLTNTKYSISEISLFTGFSSCEQLRKHFKIQENTSPQKYRDDTFAL